MLLSSQSFVAQTPDGLGTRRNIRQPPTQLLNRRNLGRPENYLHPDRVSCLHGDTSHARSITPPHQQGKTETSVSR